VVNELFVQTAAEDVEQFVNRRDEVPAPSDCRKHSFVAREVESPGCVE
jgi:hypothetical protein